MLGGPDRHTFHHLSAETTAAGVHQGHAVGFIETLRVETAGAGLQQMAAGPAYSGGSVQIEYSTFNLHSLVVCWGHDRA